MASSSSNAQAQAGSEMEEDFSALLGIEIVRGPLQLKQPLRRFVDEEELDDGLTDAQRAAEKLKEKRLIETAARTEGYKDRVRQFNEKLAKQTDHNEMPRISGQ